MPQYRVAFARFPYQNSECPDGTDWLVRTFVKASRDPRIRQADLWRADDTPVTMTRNAILKKAMSVEVDYLVMLDSDVSPDDEPDGRPFWDTTWDFMLNHPGPCMVGAPYCGPPPCCNVYVFRWANWCNDPQAFDSRLEQYSREEAAVRAGFERVAALPTGLVMLDMRAVKSLSKEVPPFYYEWKDAWQTEKASTEDVTFTRDLSMAHQIPLYCNWDSWCGHWKRYKVKKPRLICVDDVREQFREALAKPVKRGESLVMIGEGGLEEPPCQRAS